MPWLEDMEALQERPKSSLRISAMVQNFVATFNAMFR